MHAKRCRELRLQLSQNVSFSQPLHERKSTKLSRAVPVSDQTAQRPEAGVARAHMAPGILAAGKRTELSAGNAQNKRQITPDHFASFGKTIKPEPSDIQNYATEMTNLIRAHNACFSRAAAGGVG